MLYSEKLKQFEQEFPAKTITVDGAEFRYVLCGSDRDRTLVLLNGGMNTLEMWMDYARELSKDERVLLFDYPLALRTNGELVTGMHAFFEAIGVENPVFIGASDGGMTAQIYTQKYPWEAGGLILIATGGMDEKTLKTLKKQYRFGPLMLWYMKHCNYEKLKPRLIKASLRHISGESEEQIACAKDMFETLFRDISQEKDVHISSLLLDLLKQTPVTQQDFAALKGKILLILPEQDFFSAEMQKSLTELMHEPEIIRVSGGHLGTVLQAEDYIRIIREYLKKQK